MSLKNHAITTETMNSMVLGAGVLYKNLHYDATEGWTGTVLGATSGGIKFKYEAEYVDIQIDGATVAVRGITHQKVGESASLEGQMTELSRTLLVTALHLEETSSPDASYYCYTTKSSLSEEEDYLDNIAFVGLLSGGKQVMILLPNAICTEAVELDTKDATLMTYGVKFVCSAELSQDSLDHLPVKIYYPGEIIMV